MKKYLASLAVALMFVIALPAYAQDQGDSSDPYAPAQDQSTEPQPGVARVSFMQGDVSSQRGDNGDWVAATLNTPISVGDRVSTGQGGRAELQLDFADVLRLSDGATAKIAGLTRNSIQVQVGQGLVTYSVLKGSEANVEIDTPNAAIHPSGPGEYRILVNSDGETQVIVREGSADVSEPQGSTQVQRGEMITVQGTDNPQYKTDPAPAMDSWDSWNDQRDHRITSAQSWGKTDRYYTGSEDLDSYGKWSDAPDYGPVWIPSQDPGWSPYSDGRWVWEPYYGWTWVGYEPWGWAPYHYGRWFVYGGNWAWWPGPVYGYPGYYPIWSPAYVSFFGWGGGGWGVGFGFGFGFGHVGWLPCGPGDWYHPWWGRWGGRFNTVNITNINHFHEGFGPLHGRGFSNVNEAFRNERVRGGITSMDSNRFGRDAVRGHGQTMSEAAFRQTSMVSGKMPITPSRESFSPSGRAANPSSFRNAPPNSQHFFNGSARANNGNGSASHGFAGANPSGRQQSGFEGNRNAGSFARPGSQEPSRPINSARANSSNSVQSNRPGWRTFTPPQSGGAARSQQGFAGANRAEVNNSARGSFASPARQSLQAGQAENRGGWQRFTPPSRNTQPQESGRGFAQPNQSQRSFNPPSSASRGSYPNSYSRPPLNMRQPIVTPRGGGSYGTPRGGYSAPRGGGYSAPRGGGYSAPHGSGSYNAPRGGGGGGGGNHGGGGGGHSGGGRSR